MTRARSASQSLSSAPSDAASGERRISRGRADRWRVGVAVLAYSVSVAHILCSCGSRDGGTDAPRPVRAAASQVNEPTGPAASSEGTPRARAPAARMSETRWEGVHCVPGLCPGCVLTSGHIVERYAYLTCVGEMPAGEDARPRTDWGSSQFRELLVGLDDGRVQTASKEWSSDHRGGYVRFVGTAGAPYVLKMLIDSAPARGWPQTGPRPSYWLGIAALQTQGGNLANRGLVFGNWEIDRTYPDLLALTGQAAQHSMVLAAVEPAHAPSERMREGPADADHRLDEQFSAPCDSVFVHVVGSQHVYRPDRVDLDKPLQMSYGASEACGVVEDAEVVQVRCVRETYTMPSEARFDELGRTAGLGLVRLALVTSGSVNRSEPVVSSVVFAPSLEGRREEVMTAFWYDALTDKCVFAVLDGEKASDGTRWDTLRFWSSTAAGTREVLALAMPSDEEQRREFVKRVDHSALRHPPPPAPTWVRCTERGEIVWVDSTGDLYIAGG